MGRGQRSDKQLVRLNEARACPLWQVRALVETAPSEGPAAPTLYAAPVITPPTPEELRLAEARKQMLRALDTKITQEEDAKARFKCPSHAFAPRSPGWR